MRIHAALDAIRKKYKAPFEDSYEWESKSAAECNRKAMKEKGVLPLYTAPEEFFKCDPVCIGKAPTTREEKELLDRSNAKKKKPEQIINEDVITTNHPTPSPDKKTTKTEGTPTSPAERDRIIKNQFGKPRSPSVRPLAKHTTKQKKHKNMSKHSKKEHTSEDSTDFVPSCYMNFDIPLHYLNAQNQQNKKLAVSKDWGHVEPQKHFKDAVSPLKPPPPPQQESSNPSSDNRSDNSRGGPGSAPSSNRSDNRSDNSSAPKV
ncbi:hypothetical protein PMAYCL1PPCAC_02367, partial [Pristionchus mayeri]